VGEAHPPSFGFYRNSHPAVLSAAVGAVNL